MFKSLNAVNNILLAENNRTIPRDKNLLNNAANSVCFINHENKPLEFNLTLNNKHDIPHRFVAYLKDKNGQILCSGSKLAGNQVSLSSDLNIQAPYAHPTNELVLELASANGEVIVSQDVLLNIYSLPFENESDVLYRKGLPVEVLNELNKFLKPSNMATTNLNVEAPLVTVAQIVNDAHVYVQPRYDVWNGASFFGNYNNWNAITFHLNAYVAAHNSPVQGYLLNCYDCAAYLQVYLRHYNYSSYYCFMQPFGYMSLTSLIGRGMCNNPFYRGDENVRVIAQLSPNRTGFGNHAFLRLTPGTGIVDSCSGPHTGGEDINAYIASAIDTTHYVPPRSNTGTAANVGYYTGVTYVDVIQPVLVNNYADKLTDELFNTVYFNDANLNTQKVLLHLPALEPVMEKSGWKLVYNETIGGLQEALQIMFFERGEHVMYMRVFAAKDNSEYSKNRLFDLAFNIQSADHGLSKVKASPYQQHLESIAEGKQVSIIQHHNLVIHVFTSDNEVNLTDFTKVFSEPIQQGLAGTDLIKDVKVNLSTNKVNNQYRIDLLECNPYDMLEFIDLNDNIKVIDSSDNHLVFEKIENKKTTIQLWSVNRASLDITESKTLSID